MDEVIISRAITESYFKELMDYMEMDVAIVGAGPSGLTAGYYLAKSGIKTVIFERKLSIGGGMWGGGMMFNKIVVQPEGKEILDDFGVACTEYEKGYFVADSVEATSTLCSKTVQAGTKIFNLISMEDVMIREDDRIVGLVLNWSAVQMAQLHIDPLSVRSKLVIDATGHAAEVCNIVSRKTSKALQVRGEKSMWAEVAENAIVGNTIEVYPGLLVAGMAANAMAGSPRMGPIFGGMLMSGKAVAGLAIDLLKKA